MATTTLSALLRALRQATTASAASSAMDPVADRLISTSSLAESQQLVFALQQSLERFSASLPADCVYTRLQQAAAICAEPPSKAEFLGFALLEQSFQLSKTGLNPSIAAKQLLTVYTANIGVLPGFIAALIGPNGPIMSSTADIQAAEKALALLTPVLKTVLFDKTEDGTRALVLDALSRAAWNFGGDEERLNVRTVVVRILAQALELVPHSQLTKTATYAMHVVQIVDLLSSFDENSEECVMLAARTARFVLEAAQILLAKNVGVLALLQTLEQLAGAVPEALWESTFLTSSAYFLCDQCSTPLEQQLMLRVLRYTLEFGRHNSAANMDGRRVYVEILVLPLAYLIPVHGNIVPDLLKVVTEIKSIGRFHPQLQSEEDIAPTETFVHARSIIRLISQEENCKSWLDSMFLPTESTTSDSTEGKMASKWLALILVALLSDDRLFFRDSAAKCLERQVKNMPKVWGTETTKILVASLVFLISQHPVGDVNVTSTRRFASWMTSSLYSLAALAATTTDTMRVVLRLIDSMNGTAKMRSMALKLMYEVWRNESRVFPRLESMLLEPTTIDQDLERHVVKMATIKALCENDPELGVQFISSVQGFLEDELETVVAMAMDATTALCAGDCLDFYVAFKIITQKMRKNKISCAEAPLFQERLCNFYTLGGAESMANWKHASKLLDQTWELADNDVANVRKAAYSVMEKFPLEMLGLCMPVNGQDSDDDDGFTDEEVEEQIDDLMQRLQSEEDAGVRVEIEKLAARVLISESTKHTAGIGRGQRMASAASSGSVAVMSAAATKEMRALFPSRVEVLALYPPASTTTTDWSGFLLAYRPSAVIDLTNVKRKDKLVRLATQNVDELVETVTTVLKHMEIPWAAAGLSLDIDSTCQVFLLAQALMKGWKGFMATYIASLEQLAELKTPVGVDDADVAFRVFSEGVNSMTNLVLRDNSNKLGGALAAGALAGQLCESRHWQNSQLRLIYEETIEELLRRLALSIEEARVFSTEQHGSRRSSINALIALQLCFSKRRIDPSEDCSNFVCQLQKIEQMLIPLSQSAPDDLLRSCALLTFSHIGGLYLSGDGLETFEVTQWRQQRVKPIADVVFTSLLHVDHGQEQAPASYIGDFVFPLKTLEEENGTFEKVAAEYRHSKAPGAALVRWISLIGVAHLCMGFSCIKRLDWLTNVQRTLSFIWETQDSANILAIALGSILMQSVHFTLLPSSRLEKFVAKCIERMGAVPSLDDGLLVVASANVLCHLEEHGGYPDTIQNLTSLLVEKIQTTFADSSTASPATRSLMLAGIANFFFLPFGISETPVPASKSSEGGNREFTLETNTVAALVKIARSECASDESDRGFSHAVLGAVASSADAIYVSQKKKSFDVEISSLPRQSLLFKTFEWLRQASSASDDSVDAARTAASLLVCLTTARAVLPLFDYASLTHRVMVRFCSVEVSVACIKFAATQGSCDDLFACKLLASEWFVNANTAVQVEIISGLSLTATRLPTDTLRELLAIVFGVLKNTWRRDVSSKTSVLLFDSWTNMLHDVLGPALTWQIPESSLGMINQMILNDFVADLPFGPDASVFVEQFAARVLSKVTYGERDAAETFLVPTTLSASEFSVWSWWRNGVFVVELANLKVLTIAKRESSLFMQWMLRHDFDEWTEKQNVVAHLQPLIAQIGALVAQHTRPAENVSSLLDIIDVFSRSISAVAPSDIFKCRSLFEVMACTLTWNLSLSHERYLIKIARSGTAAVDNLSGENPAYELLPFGLVESACIAKSVSALGESMWALLEQLTRDDVSAARAGDSAAYISTLLVCSRQMFLAADSWHMSSSMHSAVREFWSLSE